MDFTFLTMSPEHVREISGWHCDPPYDFYDVPVSTRGDGEYEFLMMRRGA